MLDTLRADIRRFLKSGDPKTRFKDVLYLFVDQGFWAVVIFRFGRWAHHVKIPILSFVIRAVAFVLFKLTEIVTGISIPANAQIGPGLYVGHFGGIIIHNRATIGHNCSIGTGVVIGTRGLGDGGVPMIGNNVYIGVGAKVLGGIHIGSNVRIGANAVVLDDVPDNSTVVGIPAEVVRRF